MGCLKLNPYRNLQVCTGGIEASREAHYRAGKYCYGFQGQEMDNEIKGEGNSINYKYRMEDVRIGRFFAVDPLAPKYPFYSPYAFSGNRVMDRVELEGLEPIDDMQMQAREDVKQLLSGKVTQEQLAKQSLHQALGIGAVLGTFIGATEGAAAVTSIYSGYCTWFAGTSFSSYLSTGTGAAVFTYLENAYTLQGLVQTNTGLGAMSATTNLAGQFIYNDFSINESINWAQPLFAGLVKNPFYSNFGESILNVNYGYADSFATEKTLNFTGNYFDKNFFSTFGSNLIGSKIGKRFEVNGIGYKPMENVLNTFSSTVVETTENKIGDVMKDIAKSESKSKKKESSIDGGNKSMSFPLK